MGSARVPRVGCGVSPQQSSSRRREVVAALKKFALAGRHRHHARRARARYPTQSARKIARVFLLADPARERSRACPRCECCRRNGDRFSSVRSDRNNLRRKEFHPLVCPGRVAIAHTSRSRWSRITPSQSQQIWNGRPRSWCFMTCCETRLEFRWKTLLAAKKFWVTATTCFSPLNAETGRRTTWQTGRICPRILWLRPRKAQRPTALERVAKIWCAVTVFCPALRHRQHYGATAFTPAMFRTKSRTQFPAAMAILITASRWTNILPTLHLQVSHCVIAFPNLCRELCGLLRVCWHQCATIAKFGRPPYPPHLPSKKTASTFSRATGYSFSRNRAASSGFAQES